MSYACGCVTNVCKKICQKFFVFLLHITKNKKNPLKNEIKGGGDEFHHQKDYHHKEWKFFSHNRMCLVNRLINFHYRLQAYSEIA